MADIRATCPHGHTHRVAPHNMYIHIREQRYRWLCPPCGHWVDQTATVDTITERYALLTKQDLGELRALIRDAYPTN